MAVGRGLRKAPANSRLLFYVNGRAASGQNVSENRLLELLPDGTSTTPVRVPLKNPFTEFFTASWRGGSKPSRCIDLLGIRAGANQTMSYARIRLE